MSANTLRILQLYPAELGLTGDRGNVLALCTRLERSGITAERLHYNAGDEFPKQIDMLVIGNGPLSAMRRVGTDLSRHAEKIRTLATDGLPIFAVGAGAELFSHGVTALDGTGLSGIGVFPFRVIRTTERRVGYIVASGALGDLIGFEDHASTWVLDDEAVAYSRVVSGGGSIAPGDDTEAPGESLRVNNSFATNVQGPVLPLNPWLSDQLIRAAAERASLNYELSEGHGKLDVLAEGARQTITRIIDDKRFSFIGV